VTQNDLLTSKPT